MICRRAVVFVLGAVASAVLVQDRLGAAEAEKTNNPDASFLQQSLALGSLSLATSRLAEDRVTMPKLKQFAQFEVLEQTTATHIVNSLHDHAAAGPLAVPPEDQLEQRLDERGRQTLARLRGMEAGAEFTRNYFLLQADLHAQLLKLDEDYLKQGKDAALMNVVMLSDAIVREHVALLTEIKADVDEGKGAARAGR